MHHAACARVRLAGSTQHQACRGRLLVDNRENDHTRESATTLVPHQYSETSCPHLAHEQNAEERKGGRRSHAPWQVWFSCRRFSAAVGNSPQMSAKCPILSGRQVSCYASWQSLLVSCALCPARMLASWHAHLPLAWWYCLWSSMRVSWHSWTQYSPHQCP